MKINSANQVSFGKIFMTQDAAQKENFYQHAAYGIGEGSVAAFKEKYRVANLSKKFDIKVSENGADVFDKETNKTTSFSADKFADYPNALHQILNVALNYVLLKDTKTFEPYDILTKHLK